MPVPKFTDVCSKRNFIRKAQDNGWVTKQDESALSAIYEAASKEEPDEMKADLMHDAIADIFLNDVHDPKDRKSAIDRLLDRLAEAIFGKELREKVQKLDQGTITPQQMKETQLGHLKPEKAKVVRKKKLSGPAAQADKEIELTNLETPVLMSEEALKKNPILGGPRLM